MRSRDIYGRRTAANGDRLERRPDQSAGNLPPSEREQTESGSESCVPSENNGRESVPVIDRCGLWPFGPVVLGCLVSRLYQAVKVEPSASTSRPSVSHSVGFD